MEKGIRFLIVTVLAISLGLFAVACSKKTTTDAEVAPPPPVEKVAAAGQAGTEQRIEAVEESLDSKQGKRSERGDILEGRTSAAMLPVYYDFDKTNIRVDQEGRLEKNAAFLKGSQNVSIQIEGNCDEKGTNEYNLALGERRAQSAKNYLMNLGVSESRLKTISYGEEKPLLYGHDELSWAQNRRADFVIID